MMEESRPSDEQSNSSKPESDIPTALMTKGQIQRLIHCRCKVIFRQWVQLQRIVEQHEVELQQRWIAMKAQERRMLLQKTWHDMPQDHRPNIKLLLQNNFDPPLKEVLGKAFTSPELNLEDLSSPHSLPLLLNSRGRNRPGAFATIDHAQFRYRSFAHKGFPSHLKDHCMLLEDTDDPVVYGKLLSRHEWSDSWKFNRRRCIYLPCDGVSILIIQARLYPFLVACCGRVLDFTFENRLDHSFQIHSKPYPSTPNTINFISLLNTIAEVPYRIPAQLDLKKLQLLIRAQLTAVEDHLWAMRNDPCYYVSTIEEWIDHWEGHVLHTKGRKSHGFKPVLDSRVREDVLASACKAAFEAVNMWGSLYGLVTALQNIPIGLPGDEFSPPDFALAMMDFRHHLDKVAETRSDRLHTALPCSSSLRGYFVRQHITGTTPSKWNFKRSSKEYEHNDVARLDSYLTMITEREFFLHHAGEKTVVHELELASRKSINVRAHISRHVASQLSELGCCIIV